MVSVQFSTKQNIISKAIFIIIQVRHHHEKTIISKGCNTRKRKIDKIFRIQGHDDDDIDIRKYHRRMVYDICVPT